MKNLLILVEILGIFSGIFAQFPHGNTTEIPEFVFTPDPDVCSEQVKLLECSGKMQEAVRPPGAGPGQGPLISMAPPTDKAQFEISCKGVEVFQKCVDEKNLRQICAKDPILVQIDGTLGYMCQEPQKTALNSYIQCFSDYLAHPPSSAAAAPPVDVSQCNNVASQQAAGPPGTNQDSCKVLQNSMNCLRQYYVEGPCPSVEYFNILVTTSEKLIYPIDKNCHLERAAGVSTATSPPNHQNNGGNNPTQGGNGGGINGGSGESGGGINGGNEDNGGNGRNPSPQLENHGNKTCLHCNGSKSSNSVSSLSLIFAIFAIILLQKFH